MRIMVSMDCQSNLLEVVRALRASACFSGRLHSGKQQRNQNADNRDDYQQFHQGEATAVSGENFHASVLQRERFNDFDSLKAHSLVLAGWNAGWRNIIENGSQYQEENSHLPADVNHRNKKIRYNGRNDDRYCS
jgi:hypothetical protein